MLIMNFDDEAYVIDVPRTHDNDNWRICAAWTNPVEMLQAIRQRKQQLKRELMADFRLRSCPEHRITWDIAQAMERCALLHLYAMRQ